MPIITIEGADKSGKSSLFTTLKSQLTATFIQLPPYRRERMPIANDLALRDLELWEAFYNPDTLYICDRHVLVSGAVYNYLYQRPQLRPSELVSEIGVLYLDVNTEELCRRHTLCREDIQAAETYETVKQIYSDLLPHFPYRVVYEQCSIDYILSAIKELQHELRQCN